MDQAKRLKLAAIFFTVFWIGGMLWWSGEYHPAYIILLAVCGTIGGYLWYLAMRRVFQRMQLLNGITVPAGRHRDDTRVRLGAAEARLGADRWSRH
jgi:hypothetical protein